MVATCDHHPPTSAYFDFVYDCQSFHVLRQVDQAGYLELLASSLRPGGHLLLLAGASDDDGDASTEQAPVVLGPPKMRYAELRECFGEPMCEWLWCVKSRFDTTPYYQATFPQPPLAWWALLRREG
jgi:hypothetical protein